MILLECLNVSFDKIIVKNPDLGNLCSSWQFILIKKRSLKDHQCQRDNLWTLYIWVIGRSRPSTKKRKFWNVGVLIIL